MASVLGDVLMAARIQKTVIVCAAGLLAAVAVPPTWLSAAGLDVWHYPQVRRQLDEEMELAARLGIEQDEVYRRLELKAYLIADLVDGRTTLAAATDQFLALNRDHPAVMTLVRRNHSTVGGDRETTARNVIAYAGQYLSPSPGRKQTVLRRLHAEYAHQFPASAARP